MPISLRRWKQKAVRYIDSHYRATGEGTLNHDLKMYLDMTELKPLLDASVARINRGANEDQEIETIIRELAQTTLDSVSEALEERGVEGLHTQPRYEASNTHHLQPSDVFSQGLGIHHHYY